MSQDAKEKALQMIINTKQTYFPWAYILSEQTATQLRSKTLAVLRSQVARGPRSLGIYFSMCLKLHSTDLRTTMAWRLSQLLIKHGDCAAWQRCRDYQRQCTVPTGPWSSLAHILNMYDIKVEQGMLLDGQGHYWPCALPPQPQDRAPWLHGLRDAFRQPTIRRAILHRSDMQSGNADIDIARSTAFLRTVHQPKAKRIFEQLLSGGFITGERAHRWGAATTNRCPYCPAVDTMQHRLWRCRQWAPLRDPLLAPDWRWSTCFLYTGLVTMEMEIHLADIMKIHRMYLNIMMAFQEATKQRHRGWGGDDDSQPPPPPDVPTPPCQVRKRIYQKTSMEDAKKTGHIKLKRLRTKTTWPPATKKKTMEATTTEEPQQIQHNHMKKTRKKTKRLPLPDHIVWRTRSILGEPTLEPRKVLLCLHCRGVGRDKEVNRFILRHSERTCDPKRANHHGLTPKERQAVLKKAGLTAWASKRLRYRAYAALTLVT